MYTKNIEVAVKFHAKFAESNNLLLANSIANKIEDDQLRENTLSEISKNIIWVKKALSYYYREEEYLTKGQYQVMNTFLFGDVATNQIEITDFLEDKEARFE
ncbi:MAG: hypothetical protein PHD56_08720 [Anaerostipes sp.]|nr:hypothetical protein [Anaerostipes sp.]